jgi:hypothetical protein
MAVLSGLAVVSVEINSVDYDVVCDDCTVEVENSVESSEGVNSRWETVIAVKSRWSATGTFKADDTLASLLALAAGADIEHAFELDTGEEQLAGTVLLERVGRAVRNGAIQTVPLTLRGSGALTVTIPGP